MKNNSIKERQDVAQVRNERSCPQSFGSPFDITSGDDNPIPENILQSYSFAETLIILRKTIRIK